MKNFQITSMDNENFPTVSIVPPEGKSVNLFLTAEKRNEILDRLEEYSSLTITARQWSDVAKIASGAYSPLRGFVGESEYQSIMHWGRLCNGMVWSIPILLLVHADQVEDLEVGQDVVLRDRDGKNLALLHLEEVFHINRGALAERLWRTTDQKHPEVKNLYEDGSLALAGPIEVIRLHDDSSSRKINCIV
jgi:sulfate adenylyltransferase